MQHRTLVRNLEGPRLFENFLISAVAAILAIRGFLHVAGYPRMGGDVLHVAHMLWGGLLMSVAILALLIFLGPGVRSLAAVVAGLGFGTFIDELGKFITRDNNYFFEPTFALIYVVFILMYVAFQALQAGDLAGHEQVANALELSHEAVRGDLDETKRQRALDLLEQSGAPGVVGEALRHALAAAETVEPGGPGPVERVKAAVKHLYGALVNRWWFSGAVIGFFIAHSVVMLGKTLVTVEGAWPLVALLSLALVLVPAVLRSYRSREGGRRRRLTVSALLLGALVLGLLLSYPRLPALSFYGWGELVFSLVPALLVVAGVIRMRESRLAAYAHFKQAVLVLIFVAQFFAFYEAQLLALLGLVANIVVLATLRYMIRAEARLQHAVAL